MVGTTCEQREIDVHFMVQEYTGKEEAHNGDSIFVRDAGIRVFQLDSAT